MINKMDNNFLFNNKMNKLYKKCEKFFVIQNSDKKVSIIKSNLNKNTKKMLFNNNNNNNEKALICL